MARNGSGTYSLPAGNPVVTGTTISSTWANSTLSDIATTLTASVANDGQTPILASQDFGGFNISNIGTLTCVTLSVTDVSSSMNFTGSGKRITGDFSNGTVANRLLFATSTANSSTNVGVIPNGTSTTSTLNIFNAAGATNAAYGSLEITNTEVALRSAKIGSGTLLPLSVYMQSTLAAQVDTSGNVTLPTVLYSQTGIAAKSKFFGVSTNGVSANITVVADAAILESTSNLTVTVRSISLTINSAASGANGLDTGSIAASTWYSLWIIYNPTTATTVGLISTSTTAPTMPAGYTYKARVGWIRTDGTANKYPLACVQYGPRVQYRVAAGSNLTALPQINGGVAAQGAVNTPTWVASPLGAFVPPTAASLRAIITSNGGAAGQAMAAPNNSYGAFGSTTNPPPILANTYSGGNGSFQSEFLLESTDIYWAQTGNFFLWCLGWEDNI